MLRIFPSSIAGLSRNRLFPPKNRPLRLIIHRGILVGKVSHLELAGHVVLLSGVSDVHTKPVPAEIVTIVLVNQDRGRGKFPRARQ